MNTRADKLRLIQTRPWFHSIDLGDGVVTPGRLALPHLNQMLQYLNFPKSFEGLTVLDIGAWDGFFSFEAERRGAKRVVAFDVNPPDYYGFALAKELLQSRVEFVQGNVYDLAPALHGTFDVVFFFGVFYHLRYPLLALDHIHQVARQYVLLETSCLDNALILADRTTVPLENVDRRLAEIPLYRFYRYDELNPGDFSNWFSPNRRAVEDALWTAGFRPEFLAAWGDRIAFKGARLDTIPEYLLETYEGLQWSKHTDGSQSPIIFKRDSTTSADDRARVQVRVSATNELAITPQEEMRRLRAQADSAQAELAQLHTQIAELRARGDAMQKLLNSIQRTRPYRLLRRLGFWGWVEKTIQSLS
ncbi:MAG: methyltransferase domain-containing protein [Chloroflexi bacterium]|nr:methyltransferase domain-containing protein [Chloroflexota bacterium]